MARAVDSETLFINSFLLLKKKKDSKEIFKKTVQGKKAIPERSQNHFSFGSVATVAN